MNIAKFIFLGSHPCDLYEFTFDTTHLTIVYHSYYENEKNTFIDVIDYRMIISFDQIHNDEFKIFCFNHERIKIFSSFLNSDDVKLLHQTLSNIFTDEFKKKYISNKIGCFKTFSTDNSIILEHDIQQVKDLTLSFNTKLFYHNILHISKFNDHSDNNPFKQYFLILDYDYNLYYFEETYPNSNFINFYYNIIKIVNYNKIATTYNIFKKYSFSKKYK